MQLKWQFSLWCLLAKISFKDFSPCCKMWKYEKTTNNWVFCIFTQNSQSDKIIANLFRRLSKVLSNSKHQQVKWKTRWLFSLQTMARGRGVDLTLLSFLQIFLHLQIPPNVCSLTNPHKSALQIFQWSKLTFPRPAWIHQWSETFFKSNKLVENL